MGPIIPVEMRELLAHDLVVLTLHASARQHQSRRVQRRAPSGPRSLVPRVRSPVCPRPLAVGLDRLMVLASQADITVLSASGDQSKPRWTPPITRCPVSLLRRGCRRQRL